MTSESKCLEGGHNPLAHTWAEDLLAFLIGTSFIGLGMAMFAQAGLLTGGTAGVAFLLHYYSGASFGWLFFAINLPFYWLALRQMGRAFTLRTFVAVGLVSLFSSLHRTLFPFAGSLNPYYTGLLGGLLIGMGVIALFRHKASVGGVNILALYVQQRYGLRAGKLQFGFDLLVMAGALLVAGWRAAGSRLAAAAGLADRRGSHEPGDRFLSPAGSLHRPVLTRGVENCRAACLS